MNTNLSYQDQYPRSYYQIYNAVSNPGGYFECPAWNEIPTYNCDEIDSTDWSSYREQTLLKNAVEFVESEIPEDLEIDGDGDGYGSEGSNTYCDDDVPEGWVLKFQYQEN